MVGIGLPHSINDIEEEIATLHTEMMQFGGELSDQLFVDAAAEHPRPGVAPEKIDFYRKKWRPLMNEWLEFHEEHAHSFFQNLPFSGAWDRTQDFRQRFLGVREKAKEKQFRIETPEPAPPKRDPELKGLTEDALRVAMYVAIGIGGLLALRTLKSA